MHVIITQHFYFITADQEAQVTAFAKQLQNSFRQVYYRIRIPYIARVVPPPGHKTAMENATRAGGRTNLSGSASDSGSSSEEAEDSEIPLKSVDNVSLMV